MVAIRQGGPHDAAAVAALWSEAYEGTTPRTAPFTRADVLATLAQGELIVAQQGEVIVGALVLLPHGHTLAPITMSEHEEQINLVAVARNARRRGVARKLLTFTAQRAAGRGRHGLVLWTRPTHPEAPPLYEGLGYCRVPERDSAPGGHQRVAYRLALGAASNSR